MPTVKYKQGYNSRLDESLGMKHRGAHEQTEGSYMADFRSDMKKKYGKKKA